MNYIIQILCTFNSFRCETGVESDLSKCRWDSLGGGSPQCNINKDVIGVVCQTPEIALCDGNAMPFRDKCYEVKLNSIEI